MKKKLFVVLAGICVLAACKKKDGTTVSGSIVGKWQLVGFSDIYHGNDGTVRATGTIPPNPTIEFTSDGRVCNYWSSPGSTLPYKMLDNTHFVINYGNSQADTFKINKLTNDTLAIYKRTIVSEGYSEETIGFKKK